MQTVEDGNKVVPDNGPTLTVESQDKSIWSRTPGAFSLGISLIASHISSSEKGLSRELRSSWFISIKSRMTDLPD
jgi:hypothetical protein